MTQDKLHKLSDGLKNLELAVLVLKSQYSTTLTRDQYRNLYKASTLVRDTFVSVQEEIDCKKLKKEW